MEKSKNYDGHIYVKGNLQKILNTQELNSVNSSTSVLFFPDDVPLKTVKESLKTIKIFLNELIAEEERNNEEYSQK